ncbi:MAG: glycoside hydrolase family 140 protein [Acidobacteria bacterium]|nr:glycoside hydrolase family 140 protein [Acidobacteriota bacterium]
MKLVRPRGGTAVAQAVVATCLVALGASPIQAATRPEFPLRVGPTGRYLVDSKGVPFLIHGDTPWSLTHNLTYEEAVRYMKTRRDQGFNTLMVSVPDAYDAEGNKAYSPDRSGQQPFVDDDLTQPNEAYWAHADRVFKAAERLSLLLLVTPAYLGADHDGYVDVLKKNGPVRCRAYGLWLGSRYRGLKNLLWVHGGDRNPYDVRDEVRALAQGIREVDDQHLHTAHWANGTAAFDYFGDEGWLDLNSSYTYGPVAWRILADRDRVPPRPTFLIETHYEDDFGGKTADDVRAYPYRAVLAGAAGHLFGNRPLWFCGTGWEKALGSPGAGYMAHALALFRSRPWYELEPDRTHQFVVEGHWESGSDEGVQAAVTRRHDTLIAYLPRGRRTVLVDLERFSHGPLQGHWFNPRTGEATPIGSFGRSGTQAFTQPADGDWVLVLDEEARHYGPPGQSGR